MASFDFQAALTHGKMFLVKSGELDGRLDVDYYQFNQNHVDTTKLSHLIRIQGGKRLPKGENYSDVETNY
ncbi:hypothetical protein B0181_11435, partial [Moraxella caviae]